MELPCKRSLGLLSDRLERGWGSLMAGSQPPCGQMGDEHACGHRSEGQWGGKRGGQVEGLNPYKQQKKRGQRGKLTDGLGDLDLRSAGPASIGCLLGVKEMAAYPPYPCCRPYMGYAMLPP